jgi:hypothetical protein
VVPLCFFASKDPLVWSPLFTCGRSCRRWSASIAAFDYGYCCSESGFSLCLSGYSFRLVVLLAVLIRFALLIRVAVHLHEPHPYAAARQIRKLCFGRFLVTCSVYAEPSDRPTAPQRSSDSASRKLGACILSVEDITSRFATGDTWSLGAFICRAFSHLWN